MKWLVEIQYETMDGNKVVRGYNVQAKNVKAAIKLAQIRLERLKSFKKTYGGIATCGDNRYGFVPNNDKGEKE